MVRPGDRAVSQGTNRPRRGRGTKATGRRRPRTADHVRTNLRLWERQSDAYDRRCASVLGGRRAKAWGFWRIPESSLGLVGEVRGKDVLELGCGAARWSDALAADGARVVGLDLSRSQLAKARRLGRRSGGRVALLRANAERLPLAEGSFDLVLSDWGAMTFCDPKRTVPEVARILRPGGRLVFATSSPFRAVAHDRRTDRIGRTLRYGYFGLGRLDFPREVNFTLAYSDWVELFGRTGLILERLVEPQGPGGRASGYLSPREERWARRWPLESIWSARKPGARADRARARGARTTHPV